MGYRVVQLVNFIKSSSDTSVLSECSGTQQIIIEFLITRWKVEAYELNSEEMMVGRNIGAEALAGSCWKEIW